MKDKQLLALVKKAVQKDKNAFNELCNTKAREVIYLCTCEMQNPHDGEDAAQEVFIRMQKGISSLKAPEAFNVWLNRLVHSTCVNMKRDSMKHKNTIPIDAFDDSFLRDDSAFSLPQEFAEDAEKRRLLAEVIEGLPEKYRACVLLHYYQSLSYAQIAEVLDISQDAVNNNMRMARKHMKLELEERAGRPAKAWAALPMVAAGPVLAASLQEAAVLAISPAAVTQCLAAAGVGGGVAAGIGAKVVLPIVLTAALVAGAAGAVVYGAQDKAPPPAISQPAQASRPAGDVSAPADAASALSPAVVSGTVRLVGADGLDGATLALVAPAGGVVQAAVADADGGFHFAEVPGGEYRLQLTLPDYGHGARSVWVSLGEDETFFIGDENRDDFTGLEIEIDLPAEVGGYLSLRLDNEWLAYEDRELPGVTVLLLGPDGGQVAQAPVAGDGRYRFENLSIPRKGTYTIRVSVDAAVLGSELVVQDTQIELYPGYKG